MPEKYKTLDVESREYRREIDLRLRLNKILRKFSGVGVGAAESKAIISDDPARCCVAEPPRKVAPELYASQGVMQHDNGRQGMVCRLARVPFGSMEFVALDKNHMVDGW